MSARCVTGQEPFKRKLKCSNICKKKTWIKHLITVCLGCSILVCELYAGLIRFNQSHLSKYSEDWTVLNSSVCLLFLGCVDKVWAKKNFFFFSFGYWACYTIIYCDSKKLVDKIDLFCYDFVFVWFHENLVTVFRTQKSKQRIKFHAAS